MIRWKTVRSSLLFGGICFALLLLNNSLVDLQRESEKRESIPRLGRNAGAEKNGATPATSCDPSVIAEAENSKGIVKKARCTANNGKEMTCVRDENEYYFPFSFIKKQFDVSGKLSKDGSRFEMFTSYSRIRVPESNSYDPIGPFGHFATYSVETRDRVRCISAESGVPMSTQWNATPYYYPIQIAQYGLQHYSRMLANKTDDAVIEKGLETSEWKGSPDMGHTSERIFYRDSKIGDALNISTPGQLSNAGCYLFLDPSPRFHVVSFDWLPIENASFTILVRVLDSDMLVLLNYVMEHDSRCVWNDSVSFAGAEQVSFSFSLGTLQSRWQSVTRDALVDASRALSSMNTSRKKEGNVVLHPGDVKLISLGFRGVAVVRQRVEQAQSAHRKFFLTSADWFCSHQDAMGHALSVLTRAYAVTKNNSYLLVASKALDLFEKRAVVNHVVSDNPYHCGSIALYHVIDNSFSARRMGQERYLRHYSGIYRAASRSPEPATCIAIDAAVGGVRNKLFGHVWFEEYPTTPGSFVLNGFLYALIGLYDFKNVNLLDDSPEEARLGTERASVLLSVGLDSLRALLPLYDTGSGSVYDLRHIALHTAPNLARWDYHAVHVYLLKWLVQISGDKMLNETADRWIAYSWGKKAKHN